MGGLEAFLLHWVVREEADEQLVGTRRDGWRFLGAAEPTQTRSFPISPVVNFDVVVSTLQMGLHVDLIEGLRQNKMMSMCETVWKLKWRSSNVKYFETTFFEIKLNSFDSDMGCLENVSALNKLWFSSKHTGEFNSIWHQFWIVI